MNKEIIDLSKELSKEYKIWLVSYNLHCKGYNDCVAYEVKDDSFFVYDEEVKIDKLLEKRVFYVLFVFDN